MNLEDKFNDLIGKWTVHCNSSHVQFSSSIKPVILCEAYEELIGLGKEALPLIRKLYADTIQDKKIGGNNLGLSTVVFHGLPILVGEIARKEGKEYNIPEKMAGRMPEIRDYTIKWLDDNIDK